MKFTSTRYKQLVIHDLGVTFIDGEAEVADRDTIATLRGLPGEHARESGECTPLVRSVIVDHPWA